jgi:hypoxanthine phosphoribosyltransferase
MSTTPTPLFDAATLRREVEALGRRLADSFTGTEPLLLAILDGSLIFLADLVRAIPTPVRFELIHVESSSDGEDRPNALRYPIPIEIADRDVVIVKDIVTSGVIEPYLVQQLRARGAVSVRVVALLDVPEERKTEFTPDDRAFRVSRRGTFVGYGLKRGGGFGNLPYVGWLAEPVHRSGNPEPEIAV